MIQEYRNVKSLGSEAEDDLDPRRGYAPSPSWGRGACSGRCLVCFLTGLLCVVLILTVVFASTGRRVDSDMSKMQEEFDSVNRTSSAVLAALKDKEEKDLQTLVNIDKMVKNLTKVVDAVKAEFQDQIAKLRISVRTLNCRLEDVKRNRTGGQEDCCPKGWRSFGRSCYWVSSVEKTWEEARLDCEDKDSHLVVIAGYQEKQFVTQLSKPRNTWLGLNYETDQWKWLDGSTYTVRRM
ncbi:asialoglycoprotein receptor 1-like isoform X2 [Varanus komodoensis]|uniref:asialoglycoprotein receptor 1-like isoform X2 n=1 Tax=Varanus komodoensis TaxID=61221 RepID=UPI001CF7E385|nr:asialoglycoprotein receptor 1-like isoform X2 [Varanus komodoensis]